MNELNYKEVIYIEAQRNGYTAEQCGKTMTVGELIKVLEFYNEDTPIYLKHDNGYTFGSINESDIEEDHIEE